MDGAVNLESTAYISCVVFNDPSSECFVSNSQTPDSGPGSAGTDTLTGLMLGQSQGTGAFWVGSVARIIVCTGVHSATVRKAAFKALGALYGLAVS